MLGWREVARRLSENDASLVDLNSRMLRSVGGLGGRAIGEALALNTTLTQLNVSNNSVGDAVGRAIRLSWGARPGRLTL